MKRTLALLIICMLLTITTTGCADKLNSIIFNALNIETSDNEQKEEAAEEQPEYPDQTPQAIDNYPELAPQFYSNIFWAVWEMWNLIEDLREGKNVSLKSIEQAALEAVPVLEELVAAHNSLIVPEKYATIHQSMSYYGSEILRAAGDIPEMVEENDTERIIRVGDSLKLIQQSASLALKPLVN